MTDDDGAWTREALRLHQRYSEEVVEAFDICPWARKAREAGQWERVVLLQDQPSLQPSLDAIARLEGEPRLAVAILIYPRLAFTPRRFDEWASALRAADQARQAQGRPAFVSATFHPDYPLDLRSGPSLVPFLRRSPDPSLQLIRYSVIEEARGPGHGKFLFTGSLESWGELMKRHQQPSVTERITEQNYDRVRRDGPERLAAIFEALRADRDATYARLRGALVR